MKKSISNLVLLTLLLNSSIALAQSPNFEKKAVKKRQMLNEEREKHTQKPKEIRKIIRENLVVPKIKEANKILLKLKNPTTKYNADIKSDGSEIKVLNMRNFSSSDKISGRIGENIQLTMSEPKSLSLIFEVPTDQAEIILDLNNQQYTINIEELKQSSQNLDNNTFEEAEIKYLTNKKLLKESSDYKFENKDNKTGKRLERVKTKIENKEECKNLFIELKQTEFDGYEDRAENFFKLLESNPSTTACNIARKSFKEKKSEINELRFKNKKILFKDTAEGWFKTHVERVSQRMVRGMKLFQGYKDARGNLTGEFGPLNNVKLGELLKVSLITAGLDRSEVTSNSIDTTHWAAGFAQTALDLELSIASDLSDLNRAVTRGQVLQTFAESLMLINPQDPTANLDQCDLESMKASFVDFDSTHPQALAACIFVQDGIIKGSQGNLLLDGATNRAEIAKILNNVLDKYVDSENSIIDLEDSVEGFEIFDEIEEELGEIMEEMEDELEDLAEEILDAFEAISDELDEDDDENDEDDPRDEDEDEDEDDDDENEDDEDNERL